VCVGGQREEIGRVGREEENCLFIFCGMTSWGV
jgi:hypothetical protein